MASTPTPPAVTALFETHLLVADVGRSSAFYRDVVGLPVALDLPERGAVFHWIGAPGRAMLGLWSAGSAPLGMRLHLAFTTSLDDVLGAGPALRAAGVTPRSFFGDPADEPSVIGWMPAAAVYFLDPDGHQVEYLAMLDEPPRPEAGIVPWSAWDPAPARVEVRREGEDDQGELFVAERDGEVVGHLQLVDREIRNMAVASEHRGRGVGTALVEAAARAATGPLVVATAAADVGTLRFYQRCGFRLTGVEPDAFTPGTVVDGIALRDRVWLSR